MTRTVYLDWNATAPVSAEVAAAVSDAMTAAMMESGTGGNPSSIHGPGRKVRAAVEDAREAVASLAGAKPREVIFTSGATEANNMVLVGSGRETIIVSGIEHPSVLLVRDDVVRVPATLDGIVDLDRLAAALEGTDGDALVAVMLANNETGVIQPIEEVVRLAREAGALIHCDAVQAAGRIEIDIDALGVDTLSLSAHKIGGPTGVGALIVREGTPPIEPILKGGGQERSRRAGTENVPGIIGFGVAAARAADWRDEMAAIGALRDDMETRITAAAPEAVIYGAGARRLANTSSIGLPSVDCALQVMTLDLAGIAVSAGAACSSGKVAPSHVLMAMGIDRWTADTAIRVSLGRTTDAADIDAFVEAWTGMRNDAIARANAPLAGAA
ncbi:MAG: cysteine desulfurase family protein [Alphaproteobacteria bacterium]|nr:cysteine desulfurase family protein [Alphaproteobacteria bacterium]